MLIPTPKVSQGNERPISLTNTDAKILNKTEANQAQQHRKRITQQDRECKVDLTHQQNKEQKPHNQSHDTETALTQSNTL